MKDIIGKTSIWKTRRKQELPLWVHAAIQREEYKPLHFEHADD